MSIPRRTLVERFAAHLAHLLNSTNGAGVVEVQPFRIYAGVTSMLAGRGHAGTLYRDVLLGFRLAADRSPEQVATAYMDSVLDKRMMLARAEHTHAAHALFEILCRRGAAEGWAEARLSRRRPAPRQAGTGPAGFEAVSERLARLEQTHSPGNPARKTREDKGPLYLIADGRHAEVQDELSPLKAITCSPSQQHHLAEGAAFNRLCSKMIKAIETADAHYGALVRIGLFPADWDQAVNANLAKAASACVTEVRVETGGQLNDEAAWRRVFEKRPLSGFDTFDAFWSSVLGRALRFPVKIDITAFVDGQTIEPEANDEADDIDLSNAAEFGEHLNAARDEGVIDALDASVMQAVYGGAQFSGLKKLAGVAGRLKQNNWTVEDYVDDLRDRLITWSRARK